jgi:hypothetical protein
MSGNKRKLRDEEGAELQEEYSSSLDHPVPEELNKEAPSKKKDLYKQ